jgi:hypothetical protein
MSIQIANSPTKQYGTIANILDQGMLGCDTSLTLLQSPTYKVAGHVCLETLDMVGSVHGSHVLVDISPQCAIESFSKVGLKDPSHDG